MANLQANLRSQFALARDEPQLFLQSVNRLFFQNTTDAAYATVFFADYDDTARRLRYANCGHLSGILLRRNGNVELPPLHRHRPRPLRRMGLAHRRMPDSARGDMLALYTDGVTESFNDLGEEFGEHRLIEALRDKTSTNPPSTRP